MNICHNCKKTLNLTSKINRSDSCQYCLSELKVCLNCKFYEPNYFNECIESEAEYVKVKDCANFCEYFKFQLSSNKHEEEKDINNIKNQLENLFKI